MTFLGFVSQDEGMHILGGTLVFTGINLQQCLDICLMFSFCLSVDYDTASLSCFTHDTDTYCNAMLPRASVNHYNRVPCLDTGKYTLL